jgi:hypothetical protein
MFLWAENSSCPWMVCNSVIEKIKSAAVKMVSKKKKRKGQPHPCLQSQLLWTVEERALVVAAH